MSPEQARGQPLDHRSDIFNTGIVLYELLVGERCFAGSSDFSTLNLMRNAEVTPPTKINGNIPKDLERIVLKSLSLKKENRYPDALVLESTLADFAQSSGKLATASDLADFMQSLFADSRSEERGSASTGVLSLSSVVGPPPSAPPSTDDVEPGSQALARAKRRATKARSQRLAAPDQVLAVSEPPASLIAEPVAAVPEPAAPAKKSAKPKEAPAKKDRPAKKPERSAESAADKPRKPARLKSAVKSPDESKPKRKGKALSEGPKKPVGRAELRPGLTQLYRIQSGSHTRRLAVSAAIIAGFTFLGATVGWYRGRQISGQTSFREMELVGRETSSTRTVTIYIDSKPRGAKVSFDGLDLAGTTPLAVERDRDTKQHKIQLTRKGYRKTVRSLTYDEGRVTAFKADLEGRPGQLEVDSRPAGLPVKVDGVELGRTPVRHDIPFGKHKIEVGGIQGFATIERTVSVVAGKTASIEVVVPRANTIGQLDLRTRPRARIYVDGQPTRHWTNDGPIELVPDKLHRVGLRVRGTKDRHQIEVQLDKGEKRTIYLDLNTRAG